MSYVIYHIESTRFLSHATKACDKESFASQGAAKAALTRAVKKDATVFRAEYAIADRDVFHETIEKKTIRHGVALSYGKKFEVPVNTPWTSGPWSETWHCS
jgi:hypothetical protein